MVPSMPNRLPARMEKAKRKADKKSFERRPQFIEALIRWEDRFREDVNHGELVVLDGSATVWHCALERDKDGKVKYHKLKKRQTLDALKKDWKKDTASMSRIWQAMFLQREENRGFEMLGKLHFEKIVIDIL